MFTLPWLVVPLAGTPRCSAVVVIVVVVVVVVPPDGFVGFAIIEFDPFAVVVVVVFVVLIDGTLTGKRITSR